MLVLVYFVLPAELLFNEMDLVDMDLADCMNYFLVAFYHRSKFNASGINRHLRQQGLVVPAGGGDGWLA